MKLKLKLTEIKIIINITFQIKIKINIIFQINIKINIKIEIRINKLIFKLKIKLN